MSAQITRKIGIAGVVLCVDLLLSGCLEQPSPLDESIDNPETSIDNSEAIIDNRAPTITGNPKQQVAAGSVYVFEPAADDRDGDALSFKIANVPAWANFNRENGVLSGTPEAGDVGQYRGIVISVSDGSAESSLGPFSLNVDASTSNSRKFNPGHYISLNSFDTEANMLEAAQQTGVRGIQKRYHWRDLESSFDNYDFSAVLADLELVQSQGKMLVVFVEDKTFNGENPAPPYLHDEFVVTNRNGGYTAIRWDPYVVSRFSQLLETLAENLDSHPALEGIAIQESSLSLNDSTLEAFNYTPEAYRDALIDVLSTAAGHFNNSQVFWYMNFLPQNQSYLDDIATAVSSHDVAMGGPDVLPDSAPLANLTYPLYDRFQGEITLFNSIQYDSYGHRHEDMSYPTLYWTPDELFEFARDDLHVDYLFWTRKPNRNPADSYLWLDALPVIEVNASFNGNSQ